MIRSQFDELFWTNFNPAKRNVIYKVASKGRVAKYEIQFDASFYSIST